MYCASSSGSGPLISLDPGTLVEGKHGDWQCLLSVLLQRTALGAAELNMNSRSSKRVCLMRETRISLFTETASQIVELRLHLLVHPRWT